MEARPRVVTLTVSGLPDAQVWTPEGDRESAGQSVQVSVEPDSVLKTRLFVVAPGNGDERQEFQISAQAASNAEKGDTDTTQFERPENEEREP